MEGTPTRGGLRRFPTVSRAELWQDTRLLGSQAGQSRAAQRPRVAVCRRGGRGCRASTLPSSAAEREPQHHHARPPQRAAQSHGVKAGSWSQVSQGFHEAGPSSGHSRVPWLLRTSCSSAWGSPPHPNIHLRSASGPARCHRASALRSCGEGAHQSPAPSWARAFTAALGPSGGQSSAAPASSPRPVEPLLRCHSERARRGEGRRHHQAPDATEPQKYGCFRGGSVLHEGGKSTQSPVSGCGKANYLLQRTHKSQKLQSYMSRAEGSRNPVTDEATSRRLRNGGRMLLLPQG